MRCGEAGGCRGRCGDGRIPSGSRRERGGDDDKTLEFEELGVVTSGSVEVDGMEWGAIEEWKEKYDTAIENYLSKEEAGSALSSI